MIDYITNAAVWWVTGWLGFALYWIPGAANTTAYAFRFAQMFRDDVKSRDSEKYYSPNLTVGYMLAHIIWAWIPIANLGALIFDVLGDYWSWIEKFLSIPLVPRRPS